MSLEKCKCVEDILKDGYLEMKDRTLLQMIDEAKLIRISGSKLNAIMQNEYLNSSERNNIRKMRRIVINRGTAKQSRIRKKSEYDLLEREVTELSELRQKLRIEKMELRKEINEMTVVFIKAGSSD